MGFNPATITPTLWLDGNDKAKIVSSIDNTQTIIDSITTKGTSILTSTPFASGNIKNKPRNNGEGLYCNGNGYGFSLGANTDFNYLHNSGGFNLYLVFKQLPQADQTTTRAIFHTATGATQTGISIAYYNRSATSNIKTLQIFISNGSGGTAQFLINGTSNCITDNEYHILKLKFTGTSLTAYVKNQNASSFTLIGADNTGSTSSANSTNPLNFCTSGGTGWTGYFKHLITFNRQLNSTEELSMDSWATAEMSKVVVEIPIDVYAGIGQSNTHGRGANAQIASVLNGAVGGYTYYPINTTNIASAGIASAYWNKLQVGKNSNPDFGETVHGLWNKFGYEMKQFTGNDPAFTVMGVSSIGLASRTGFVDWHPNSVESGDLFPKWRDYFIKYALQDLKHVMRRTPVIRGLIITECEQDASLAGGGTTTRADMELFIKSIIDTINALGYDTSKLRVNIVRIANSYGGYNAVALANVRTGIVQVATQTGGTDFTGYIPSKMKSITWTDSDTIDLNPDLLHYSAPGLDALGNIMFNYFKNYIGE